MSIMMGIETAIRSIRTHTTAINTTAHNIANYNNDWYSRQLANISSTQPYSMPGIAGQIGTGSKIAAIERIRDLYLDAQIMTQREHLGKWTVLERTYQNLRAIFPEVDGIDIGLQRQISEFFDAWKALSVEAQKEAAGELADVNGAKREIYKKADGIAQLFNSKASTLTNMQIDLNTDLRMIVHDINMYVKQVYELNKQIVKVGNSGERPNDLLDKRNEALNKLSQLVNINTGYRMDGSVVVHIKGHVLVNGADGYNEMTTVGGRKDSKLEEVALFEYKGAPPVNIDKVIERGALAGIMEARDTVIHWYKSNLNSLAHSLITVVNRIHRTGANELGEQANTDFFVGNSSTSIAVNPELFAGQNIAYKKFGDSDIADILGNLDNKIINNWITSPSLGFKSDELIGRAGRLNINGIEIQYYADETIGELVAKINTNVSSFSAVFDDRAETFFMVANELFTIEEYYGAGVDSERGVLGKLGLVQRQISAAPINYLGSAAGNSVKDTGATWNQQSLQLDVEATETGRVIVTYGGERYSVDWNANQVPQETAFAIRFFAFPPSVNPSFSVYSFSPDAQKFSFGMGLIQTADGQNTILPFLISDERGNMTQVMKLPGNMRFGEYYETMVGKLRGELDTSENIRGQYQASLEQLEGMQKKITEVNLDEELMRAKQYQRAYDASVKLMAVLDQMLNILINRTATPSDSWD